jgi:hypothetical protein
MVVAGCGGAQFWAHCRIDYWFGGVTSNSEDARYRAHGKHLEKIVGLFSRKYETFRCTIADAKS